MTDHSKILRKFVTSTTELVDGLLEALRKEKHIETQRLFMKFKKGFLEPLDSVLDAYPNRKKIDRQLKSEIQALRTIFADTIQAFLDNEIGRSRFRETHDSLKQSWDNFKATFDPTETLNVKTDDSITLADIFDKSRENKRTYHQLIKKMINKHGQLRKGMPEFEIIKADILVQMTPFITDTDISRISASWMRVIEGYTYLPQQKIMIFNSKLSRHSNIEDYAKWLTTQIGGKQVYVAVTPVDLEEGLGIAWLLTPDDYEVLIERRDLEVWCSVLLN